MKQETKDLLEKISNQVYLDKLDTEISKIVIEYFQNENFEEIISHLKSEYTYSLEIISVLYILERFDMILEVGDHMNDLSAGDIFTSIFLSEQRLLAIKDSLIKEKVYDIFKSTSISEWHNTPEIKRYFAKSISSSRTYLGFAKMILSQTAILAVKELIIDSDFKTRVIAARYLSKSKDEKVIEFLKIGLMDSKKEVRKESREGIKAILGEEGYNNIVAEMKNETKSIHEKSISAFGEIKEKLEGVPKKIIILYETFSGEISEKTSKVASTVKSFFNRDNK